MSPTESVNLSLSYIYICNSLALIAIEFVLAMEVPWDDRHQSTTLLLW